MDGDESLERVTGIDNAWDAVVVGAGPAGSLAALLLARRGLKTLLVDRKKFPRDKVCGGCLNACAVAALQRAGMEQILELPAAAPIDWLHLANRRRRATMAIRGGAAIVRSEFDARLAREAEKRGATFLSETTASVEPAIEGNFRRIELRSRGRLRGDAYAKVVLACDGLGSACTSRLVNIRQSPSPRSRIGLGAIVERYDEDIPPRAIGMAIGRRGYVGRVRLGDGRMNVAAAMDPDFVRLLGAEAAIQRTLAECGLCDGLHADFRVRGTIPLTRRTRRVADHRLFLLGDACGYVEPFTGEGMAIALETALAVVPLAASAKMGWRPSFVREWQKTIRRLTARRNALCRGVSELCRHPWLVDAALATVRHGPRWIDSLVSRMNVLPQAQESATTWDSI
jgi:flavin-dependent dehydrogenase